MAGDVRGALVVDEFGGKTLGRPTPDQGLGWDLATERIVVKIRWFGVLMGYVLVQTRTGLHDPWAVRAFLALGAGYAALDTVFYYRLREVVLNRWPLVVSLMESVFIALLCYHDTGLTSPFRWYYLLSLICCAIRYRRSVAWLTFAFHCLSLVALAAVLAIDPGGESGWPWTIAIMAWATWASASLAGLLRDAGARLEQLNAELQEHHRALEQRVAERTDALRASQARSIQQEKMAAFGLLAAGIAHEVGNPLAALSSLVQILQRRHPDPYTAAKLDLAATQLGRIRRTIRELVDFSRPASTAVSRFRLAEVVEEALGIAKYYPRTRQRAITLILADDLPPVRGVRDHLTQVVLNLVLNAVDATDRGGRIHLEGRSEGDWVVVTVGDDGRGIALADRCRLFQPFFTTKPHGTGLGLFVSRQIVEEMGGTLSYVTEPGTGSTFSVRLPADRPAAVCRFRCPSASPVPVGRGRVMSPDRRRSRLRSPAALRGTGRIPVPGRILIVDDEEVIAATLEEFLSGEGYEVASAHDAESALALVERFEPDVALCDVQLPGLDGLGLLDRLLQIRPETLVLMITAYATVENAVAAFRRGAQDYLMKPVIFDELLAKLDRLMGYRRLLLENQTLRRQLHAPGESTLMIGQGPAMRAIQTLIRKVGPTRSNVLITGESGTGKELVARALHALGPDAEAAFLAINGAAIPHDLLENQLFGHVRGAFTGADRDRVGLFLAAGRGTVFLDEIGEMPLPIQAKLLRAIENKEVLPVGANRPVAFQARVVTATNKDLAAEVAALRFRADLYYRLNVVAIHLPPLRERREDIPELVASLLAAHARGLGKRVDGVDNASIRGLMTAPWKGNIRELDNALERAVILAEGPILTPDDFPPGLITESSPAATGDDLRAGVRDYERQHIQRVLADCGDDKREAARRLGLGLSSLYRKLEELGVQ